ncbi:MAG TPA: DEAD/DEAH box helicase [Candidatus Bilamarchaeaceae archaeon]|nr:DEAD/DEAH box helicase [Candidatus Bilamarchaeaceae archaeon]
MPTLVELIRERFPDFTEVQKQAMPQVLEGKHGLILAPTGSGKTEAALLPILEKIERDKPGIQALYITPLRSLGRDMLARFSWWCERLDITHSIRHGDSTVAERTQHRKKPPQIMVITVETLQALLLGRIMRMHLRNVRHVIVDEVHDILDNKRGTQLSLALERLETLAPKFQRIALSATVAKPHEAAKLIFGFRDYFLVEVGRGRKMDIEVEFHPKYEQRLKRLKELVEKEKTLLFVNTRSTAEEIGAALKQSGVQMEIHHGSLSKEVRIGAEERFKKGEVGVLLATSSMELGLDIGDVDQVVQYGSPHQVFRLMQRIGRSGHTLAGVPKGVVLATDLDDRYEADALKMFAAQGWMEPKNMESGARDVIAHQLVGLCLDKGRITLREAHGVFQQAGAYGINGQQLQRVALQLYSEGLIFYNENEEEVWVKAKPEAREYYYSYLSTIPKEKRYIMRDVLSNRIIASLDERFVVNLEPGLSFLAKGSAWQVIEIEEEVLVEPSQATEILVPTWVGEDIPVVYEVAQQVARLRSSHKEAPSSKDIAIEMVDELWVMHTCLGSKVNESLGRMLAHRLSERLGEPCQMVSDAYRIMLRLPYVLEGKYLIEQWEKMGDARSELEQSLYGSALLRFKFMHVARLFGLLEGDATVGQRFISTMKNSVVYQETLRSIFFRYFDTEKTQEFLEGIRKGKIKLKIEKREKPSLFARVGLDRLGGKEAVGAFEPRKHMIAAFKEKLLSKTMELQCLSCGATRLVWLANATEPIACPKCNEKTLAVRYQKEKKKEMEHTAGLIRNYGKRALLALASYGVGATTAERILRKLHPDEEGFFWDLIEAQKHFIKNRKYWKLDG